jgi:hypothetical protein
MPKIDLFGYQLETLDKLKSGSILCGGVGSGKSLTSLAYYLVKECQGYINPENGSIWHEMKNPKDLFIITTARKRDTREWENECDKFPLCRDRRGSISGVQVTIDSWNNIGKYVDVTNAFFIFDEQRLVGSGAWVKSFIKIAKANRWILLTATPGDTWLDYAPVFVANGFYKNRTDFVRQHVIFNSFVNYPMIDRYVDTLKLINFRKQIIVYMDYKKKTVMHHLTLSASYDQVLYDTVTKKRWNVYEDKPIANISELCFVLRKITNSDPSRIDAIAELLEKKKKIIVFYNFNYELEMLRQLGNDLKIVTTEWNGHKHEAIPKEESWMYLVQYTSGAEGWNCIETDTILFYSQNYSYKTMLQAAGRIDRLNSPFIDLYYYHILSDSRMDVAIASALDNKKNFNEYDFITF